MIARILKFDLRWLAHLITLGLLLSWPIAGAQRTAAEEPRSNPAITPATRCLVIELFREDNSPQCDDAVEMLTQLHERRPGTRVITWDVTNQPAAAARWQAIAQHFRVTKPRFPAFYMQRQLLTGYDDPPAVEQQIERLLTVHVYWREGCPRCAVGKAYLAKVLPKYPMYHVVYHEITHDLQARREFETVTRNAGIAAPVVPTFAIGGEVVSGFLDETITGTRLETLLTRGLGGCGAKPATNDGGLLWPPAFWTLAAIVDDKAPLPDADDLPPIGGEDLPPLLTDQPGPTPNDAITVPWLGAFRVRDMGLTAFTLTIGLIDGFNPCAMWVLLFLLSLLVNLRDRAKILAVAGTFVVVSGLAYLAFMAAWLNVFLFIGYMRPAQLILGGLAVVIGAINVKDFFAFKWGFSLSIPEAAKPGIYTRAREIVLAKYLFAAIAGAAVLAVLVNTVELLCSAGFPAVYTQILTNHQLPWWENYAFLSLYIFAYMFDDLLMVSVVVVTLTKTKLQETGGRWLKLVSGAVILVLGLAMIFRPEWLM